MEARRGAGGVPAQKVRDAGGRWCGGARDATGVLGLEAAKEPGCQGAAGAKCLGAGCGDAGLRGGMGVSGCRCSG